MSRSGCALKSFVGKFSLSLIIFGDPQCGLLSHVSSLRLSSGHSGLVLTLSTDYAARASLPSPYSLVSDASLWATFPLATVVRCVFCEFFLFFPLSCLCCPLRFQNFQQVCLWEGFLLFGNFSFLTTPSPGWVSVPNSFVSLFVFCLLSYLFLKKMGFLSGCLVSPAGIQKLFYGSCSAFKWSFDEFVRDKVVSHPIPLPSWMQTLVIAFQEANC